MVSSKNGNRQVDNNNNEVTVAEITAGIPEEEMKEHGSTPSLTKPCIHMKGQKLPAETIMNSYLAKQTNPEDDEGEEEGGTVATMGQVRKILCAPTIQVSL